MPTPARSSKATTASLNLPRPPFFRAAALPGNEPAPGRLAIPWLLIPGLRTIPWWLPDFAATLWLGTGLWALPDFAEIPWALDPGFAEIPWALDPGFCTGLGAVPWWLPVDLNTVAHFGHLTCVPAGIG